MGYKNIENCVDGHEICARIMQLGGTVSDYRRWRDDGRIKIAETRIRYQMGNYYRKYFFKNEEIEKLTEEKVSKWKAEDQIKRHERRVTAAKKAAVGAAEKRARNQIRKTQIEQEYLKFGKFTKIVLDTETTGLGAKDEILELAVIDGETGMTLFHQFFRPVRNQSWDEAEKIHGISPKDVSECYPISVYRSVIQKILDQAEEVIGYNVSFDIGMLKRAGFEMHGKAIDVMIPFAEIYGERSSYFGGYKWQKLTTCSNYYGYDWGESEAHGALADACATRFCWMKMKDNELEKISEC